MRLPFTLIGGVSTVVPVAIAVVASRIAVVVEMTNLLPLRLLKSPASFQSCCTTQGTGVVLESH